jgi:hypothetical protein
VVKKGLYGKKRTNLHQHTFFSSRAGPREGGPKMSAKKSILISTLIILITSVCGTAMAAKEKETGANEIVLEYMFNEPAVSTMIGYDLLHIKGLEKYERIGAPIVPLRPVMVLIPFGKKVAATKVTALGTRQVPGKYRLVPAQKPYPIGYQGDLKPTEPDAAIYKSDSPWPGRYYEEIGTQSKGGYHLFLVNLLPMQYVPAKGEVSYATKLVLTITLTDEQKPAAVRPSSTTRTALANSVDNPGALESYPTVSMLKSSGTSLALPPGGPFKYVVITSQELKDNTPGPWNFQALCDTRTAEGLPATIVDTNWIYDNYDGTRPDGGSDNQTRIRNFLIDVNQNWDTEYVLLGGTNDIVPARNFLSRPDIPGIPTDMYYGCVDGTFDYDANGRYGAAVFELKCFFRYFRDAIKFDSES